jgi:hypothetical protein
MNPAMTLTSLRILFFSLQMTDVLMTLLAFYLATTNPIAASTLLGSVVLKLSAILITSRLESESLVNRGNLAYSGMLAWNVYVISHLSTQAWSRSFTQEDELRMSDAGTAGRVFSLLRHIQSQRLRVLLSSRLD